MKEKDFDPLYTPEEVVEKLRLGDVQWIYQRIHSGTLPFPFIHVGRRLRFRASWFRSSSLHAASSSLRFWNRRHSARWSAVSPDAISA